MDTPSLPDTLSETLSLAVADARVLSRTDYHPHYRFWHGYSSEQQHLCQVCLAGSIIARSLKVDPRTITSPAAFPPGTDHKLRAINACRTGEFFNAYCIFHNSLPSLESQKRLHSLPSPSHFLFIGWQEFDKHLASLEAIVPLLEEIELEALKS
ncbi:MAG: hypothetical protein OXB98_18030 [Bryobacterales bacterium]|nr:hypothetical protein [Bryobacterales bacterium]